MRSCDVLVLGGGIIGCAVAEELARRGRRVALIERGRLGAEASSAAAGILSAQMDIPAPGPLLELCQEARRLYPAWVRRLERASGMCVGYHEDGILYVAATVREERVMAARATWQRRRHLKVETLSPSQVKRREPGVDGRARCGFWFPAEAQVDNVRLMAALGRTCRAAGVVVHEDTMVRRLLLRRRAVQGVETTRGTVRGPVVVSCVGSWAGVANLPRLPVVPARGQMLAFRGPAGLFRSAVMSERAYVVQRRDGRLIVGSTIEFAGFDKSLTLTGMHDILCGLRRMSSALTSCVFLDAWTGLRPHSPDGLPIIGPTATSGLYAATGHFRHGILLAPMTAAALADLILREKPCEDFSAFSPARFS